MDLPSWDPVTIHGSGEIRLQGAQISRFLQRFEGCRASVPRSLLLSGAHPLDHWQLGNIAAWQMKLHRSPLGIVQTHREVDRLILAIER